MAAAKLVLASNAFLSRSPQPGDIDTVNIALYLTNMSSDRTLLG
jgi:hypothetical protein